jgi:oleandomycin transport system permease protein
MLVKSPNAVPGTLIGVLFPLTFGSNVFVEPSTMPGWLRGWVEINPVSHLTDAARGLLLGGPWASSAAWAFLWAVAIAAVFFPLALRAYLRRVG